jgi:uncharacterized protein with von Willebrand factor type A (vWA) domain
MRRGNRPVLEKHRSLDNLLLNITSKDIIYKVIRRTIGCMLPDDLRELYEESPHVQIIGTDSFFIHYSVTPMIVEHHYDRLLERVREFMMKYMMTPQYEKVREKTLLNENLSLIYATELTRNILEAIQRRGKEKRGEGKSLSKEGGDNGKNDARKKEKNDDSEEKTGLMVFDNNDDKEQELTSNHENIRDVLDEASKKASKTVEGARAIMDVLGGGGAGMNPGDLKRIASIAKSIVEVREVEKVVRLALETVKGMPKTHQLLKKNDVLGDEVRGYGRTRRIEKILPRELAFPDDILFYKLAGEGVLRREKAVSKQGALYILLDKSGSMSGYKMIWSRSVALAFNKIARQRNIKFYLRMFDTTVYPAEKPVEDDIEALELILTAPTNGGTRIAKAITKAVEDLYKNSDERETDTIILITDGEDNVSIDKAFLKKNDVRLITVMVGGDNNNLKNISTAYFNASLTVDDALYLISSTEKIVLKKKLSKPKYYYT